jgi:hypothetical protein
MKIKGVEGLTTEQVNAELQRGGKFVIFQYCISVVVLTFKRPSDIYLIRAGENPLGKHIGFTLLSLVAGWWGIPWGPIFTIGSIYTNLRGGKDVTDAVLKSLKPSPAPTVPAAPTAAGV